MTAFKPRKIQYKRRRHWLHLLPAGVRHASYIFFLFVFKEHSTFVRRELQVSKSSPASVSVCKLISRLKSPCITSVHGAACFVQWSCDPGVSHLLTSGPVVTCSWPRCWSPGRRPWSDWRDTNRRLRQLRHGSETLSPPAPTWEHKHTDCVRCSRFTYNKAKKQKCMPACHLLTCSFEARKPPPCSGKYSRCGRRLRKLCPWRWPPRPPRAEWSAQIRTPSGAFVGQNAPQSSGVNCHQIRLQDKNK